MDMTIYELEVFKKALLQLETLQPEEFKRMSQSQSNPVTQKDIDIAFNYYCQMTDDEHKVVHDYAEKLTIEDVLEMLYHKNRKRFDALDDHDVQYINRLITYGKEVLANFKETFNNLYHVIKEGGEIETGNAPIQ